MAGQHSANFHEVIDTLHAFDNGVGDNQKSEPYNILGAIDDLDGRSGKDFQDNWAIWGTDSSTIFEMNCAPIGD